LCLRIKLNGHVWAESNAKSPRLKKITPKKIGWSILFHLVLWTFFTGGILLTKKPEKLEHRRIREKRVVKIPIIANARQLTPEQENAEILKMAKLEDGAKEAWRKLHDYQRRYEDQVKRMEQLGLIEQYKKILGRSYDVDFGDFGA